MYRFFNASGQFGQVIAWYQLSSEIWKGVDRVRESSGNLPRLLWYGRKRAVVVGIIASCFLMIFSPRSVISISRFTSTSMAFDIADADFRF